MKNGAATLPAGITREVALYFRAHLRDARAGVLRDSEAFESIVIVLERLGRMLCPAGNGLGSFGPTLGKLVAGSPLANDIPRSFPLYHLEFSTLFELVREGRNAAVHEGALARHVAAHSLELALIIEDALMPSNGTVAEFMVRGPVIAAPWHPLSFVRQAMLANSFSYLPFRTNEAAGNPWRLISDVAVAEYLRAAGPDARRDRLQMRIETAAMDGLRLDTPTCVGPDHLTAELSAEMIALPILVVDKTSDELIGIITAFDLL